LPALSADLGAAGPDAVAAPPRRRRLQADVRPARFGWPILSQGRATAGEYGGRRWPAGPLGPAAGV